MTQLSYPNRVRTPSGSEADQLFKLRLDPVAIAHGSDTNTKAASSRHTPQLQSDALHEIGKARIGAQRIESVIDFDSEDYQIVRIDCFVQPQERLIFVSQRSVDQPYGRGGYVTLLAQLLQRFSTQSFVIRADAI